MALRDERHACRRQLFELGNVEKVPQGADRLSTLQGTSAGDLLVWSMMGTELSIGRFGN
jgi:hypothetical protein